MAVPRYLRPRFFSTGRALGRGELRHPGVELVAQHLRGRSPGRQHTHDWLLSLPRGPAGVFDQDMPTSSSLAGSLRQAVQRVRSSRYPAATSWCQARRRTGDPSSPPARIHLGGRTPGLSPVRAHLRLSRGLAIAERARRVPPGRWTDIARFSARRASTRSKSSAAGWVREEHEKFRPPALGHLDAPPVTDERAEDSYGACERHAQAKIMVGQLPGQAMRRGEAP